MFKVENLRVAVLAAKAYTALALRDYIPAGAFANELLARWTCLLIYPYVILQFSQLDHIRESLPGGYKLLAHLYAAESLILQDKVGLYNVCVMHNAAGRFQWKLSTQTFHRWATRSSI